MITRSGILIVLAAVGVASADDPSEMLLQGLQGPSCEARRSAIDTYLRSSDNKAGRNTGLRAMTISDPEVRARIGALLQIIEDSRDGVARMTSLAEEISKVGDLPPSAQGPRLRDYRTELLKLVKDPKQTLTARMGAPFLLTRLLRAGSDENPDWIPQWQGELDAMLRSRDDALRAIRGVDAAIGRFPEGSDPRTYDVARPDPGTGEPLPGGSSSLRYGAGADHRRRPML